MGNVYMEAEQVRFKNSSYHNLQTAVSAALEGGGGGGTTVVANPEGSATADLGKLQVGTTIYGIPAEAGDISYDNTSSGMAADDVQEAIDELSAAIPGVATTSAPGIVQPDGATITIADGVISAVGGGGGNAYGVFSTTETTVGSWNGQPLYRKVVSLTGGLPNNTSEYFDTGLANSAVTVRNFTGYAWNNADVMLPIPYFSLGTTNISIAKVAQNSNVKFMITTGSDMTAYANGYLIVEYTKNSENP